MASRANPDVTISGAGIGGLASALSLQKGDVGCLVLEKSPTLGEVGAGIQISPNARHVLAALGVGDAVSAAGFEPEHAVIQDGISGKVISKTKLKQMCIQRYGAPYIHIHRADLHDILHKAALASGVEIRLGEEVTEVTQTNDAVTAHTQKGSYESDLLIAADGGRSTHQTKLNPDSGFAFRGQVAWRGNIPTKDLPKGLLPPDATVWIGPKHHFVSYYIRGGSLVNFVAVQERANWTNSDWRQEGDVQELRDAFKNWHPSIRQILEACTHTNLWALYDSDPLANWTDCRLALLGDAAHPMLPFMAQGAGMAIEDAFVLAKCLSRQDIPEALKTYQSQRETRTAMVQKMSRDNAKLFHRGDDLKDILQKAKLALGSRFPSLVQHQLDKVYGVDVTRS